MAAANQTYDLVLMLDLSATDDARAKIVADTKASIAASGKIVTEHDWGTRALAYQIDRREQAEYHLFQFEAPPSLPDTITRTLRITDGVVRHRIVKLPPGMPDAPASPAPSPVTAESSPSPIAPAPAPAAAAAAAPPAVAQPPAAEQPAAVAEEEPAVAAEEPEPQHEPAVVPADAGEPSA